MTNQTRYKKNPDFIYRKIVDESILVPIHRDVANMESIYTLNSVGAFIWEFLAQPANREELQMAVLKEYDADPEILSEDIERFLSQMIAIGAIQEV